MLLSLSYSSPLIPELDRIRWIKSLNEQKQLRYSASICTSAFNELSSIPCICPLSL